MNPHAARSGLPDFCSLKSACSSVALGDAAAPRDSWADHDDKDSDEITIYREYKARSVLYGIETQVETELSERANAGPPSLHSHFLPPLCSIGHPL